MSSTTPTPPSTTEPPSPPLEDPPTSLLAHASNSVSDHETDEEPLVKPCQEPDDCCVVCFERDTNVTLDPCGHSNLCDVCVSRLVKRRCPTCRARARKVAIRYPGKDVVTKAVREIIAERKLRESKVLEDTLQVVFLGPEKVGKKTLVRKLISKFPLAGADLLDPMSLDVFSDGTDFNPNATIAGVNVRLTVLRRTTLTSRRMVLDDVRVLKPDVLVLCCSAHVGSTFETIMSWDKVLRSNFQKPRVWALLTLDDAEGNTSTSLDTGHDVAGAINAIMPADSRPKGHYLCSPGEQFSIGFKSLAKDIVAIGRIARDAELAASFAQEEQRSLADHEAAGTLSDRAAANLVIATNGLGVPSSSQPGRGAGRTSGPRPFLFRGFRERGSNNGQGVSFSGFVNWLAGSHD